MKTFKEAMEGLRASAASLDGDRPFAASEIDDLLDVVEARVGALQAKLDRVMMEHCPEEMTTKQIEEWAKHQKPVADGGKGGMSFDV